MTFILFTVMFMQKIELNCPHEFRLCHRLESASNLSRMPLRGRTLFLSLFLVFTVAAFAQAALGEPVSIKTMNGRTLPLYSSCKALVVGVANYDHFRPRPDAVKAARDIFCEFRRLGFAATLLIDPTGEALHTALDQLVEENGDASETGVVLYFAGHSQTSVSIGGAKESWLVASDAPRPDSDRRGFEEKSLNAADIQDLAGRINARHFLIVIDAPFDSDLFQGKIDSLRAINETAAQPARQFITAGRRNADVDDAVVFGRYLVSGLRGDADLVYDGNITASELSLYLLNIVGKKSGDRLQPQYGRLSVPGTNIGDFVFLRSDRRPSTGYLFVDVQPASATIRIMNIRPRFYQGMQLSPGTYQLQVSAQGYDTITQSIDLTAGENRTEVIELSKIEEEYRNHLGMTFMRIKPGRFRMGSPDGEAGRGSDETLHLVKLTQAFYMQQTEVSVAQFGQFIRATGYRTEAEKGGGCWINSGGRGWTRNAGACWKQPGAMGAGGRHPAVCVTWNDAKAFALWLSDKDGRRYRLPTEAEWEYAARAGTVTPFAFGRCLSSDEANYAGVGRSYQLCTTVFSEMRGCAVDTGTLEPNPWALYDMHGNAAEWCADGYGPYASGSVSVNPQGPGNAADRVIRGGHWQAAAAGCRSAWRGRFPPGFASDVVGFRLVMSP